MSEAADTRRAALTVFVLSASAMTAELALTRVFSVLIWYHLAFFAISVALLGTAVGALAAHVLSTREAAPFDARRAAGLSAVFAAVSLVALELLLLRQVTTQGMGFFTELNLGLLLFFVMTAAPFAGIGMSLTLCLVGRARHMRWLYLGDLAGAALAAASLPLVVSLLGGPRALVATAIPLAIVGAVLLSAHARVAAASLAAVLVLIAAAGGEAWFGIRTAKGFPIPADKVEFERWNSFSLVTVLRDVPFAGWGRSPKVQTPPREQRAVLIDWNAMTPLVRFDGPLSALTELRFDLTSAAHAVAAPRGKRVCVIGAGAGRDVLTALQAGAARVTAVEINPLVARDVMLGAYRTFSGGLYAREDVELVVEDGRSFVRRTDQRFAVLQLSMVDTSAATSAGAYALTENSLYTTEAFGDYLGVLDEGGVLSVGSASFEGLATGARLVSVARAALVARGKDPRRSVIVFSTPWQGQKDAELFHVLVRPDGWSTADVDRAVEWARVLGFQVVSLPDRVVTDGSREHGWVRALLETPGAALPPALAALPIDLAPTTDDRPFFFYQNRLADLPRALAGPTPSHFYGNGLVFLARLSLVTLVAMALFLAVPRFVKRDLAVPRDAAAYAFLLGTGFMLLELPLLQRFNMLLGNPTTSLAVVLATLLISGGLGSATLNREGAGELRRLRSVLGALMVYGILLLASVPAWSSALRAASATTRTVAVVALLAPLGFLAGAPLSIGLRLVAARGGAHVAFLWAINGAASVLGSVGATLLALHVGLRATTLVGLAVYLGVFVLAGRLAREG
ncbi:MAG: hypothetical protein JNL79_39350 [Myxococcales bacterium]|nr:hypothetical protein [Myxococcales bacterium]